MQIVEALKRQRETIVRTSRRQITHRMRLALNRNSCNSQRRTTSLFGNRENRTKMRKNTLVDVIVSNSDSNARMQPKYNHIVSMVFFVASMTTTTASSPFFVLKEMESIFIGTLTAIDFVQLSFYVFDMSPSHGCESGERTVQCTLPATAVAGTHLVCVACDYNILIFILCVTLLLGGFALRCWMCSQASVRWATTMALCATRAHIHQTLSLRFYFRFRSRCDILFHSSIFLRHPPLPRNPFFDVFFFVCRLNAFSPMRNERKIILCMYAAAAAVIIVELRQFSWQIVFHRSNVEWTGHGQRPSSRHAFNWWKLRETWPTWRAHARPSFCGHLLGSVFLRASATGLGCAWTGRGPGPCHFHPSLNDLWIPVFASHFIVFIFRPSVSPALLHVQFDALPRIWWKTLWWDQSILLLSFFVCVCLCSHEMNDEG